MKKFQFCPVCKHKLAHKIKHIVCASCGFLYYFNPCPAGGVFLFNAKKELMLVKRKVAPKKGYWDVPGGYMDFDESMEECQAREIQEELNVKISHLRYVGSYPDIYHFKGLTYKNIVYIHSAKIASGIIQPKDDVASIQFFPLSKIPFEKIAFPGLKKFLKQYTKKSH